MTKNSYLLRFHRMYCDRVAHLKDHIRDLRSELPEDAFRVHPDVKFAKRLRDATREIIPEDPNLSDYRLKGDLKKYRRYKKGLQRYRLFFCFSSQPPIIVYLYLNDEKTLRKEGAKTGPYAIFSKLVKNKKVSTDPSDPRLQNWISDNATI